MENPAEFILSMLTGASKSQKDFGCELLLMYPRHYNAAIQKAVYKMRNDAVIVGMLCDKHGAHLMTSKMYDHFFQKIIGGQLHYLCAGFERFAAENGKVQDHG